MRMKGGRNLFVAKFIKNVIFTKIKFKMMKKIKMLTLGLFLSTTLTTFAQKNYSVKQDTRIWLSFFVPSVDVELQIGEISSLRFGVALNGAGDFESVNGETTKNTLEFFPEIKLEPRFYVSRNRRLDLGKSVDYFSGGYLGLPMATYLDKGYSFGAIYGIQAMFGNSTRFFYDLGMGLGYYKLDVSDMYKEFTGGGPIGKLGLGIRLM